jgi:hypothetical protein
MKELERNLKISSCFFDFRQVGKLVETSFVFKKKKIVYQRFFKNGEFFQEEFLKLCNNDMRKYIKENLDEDPAECSETFR